MGWWEIDTVRKELPEASVEDKNLACFSPLALAGRTKLTAKPFQREGERGEGRERWEGRGGRKEKEKPFQKEGWGGKCNGENRVQPQVPQVSAEECCEVWGQSSLADKERSVFNLGGKCPFLKDKSRNVHLT